MTDELTKTFFDTFGIEVSYRYNCEIIDTIEPDDKFLLPMCSAGEVISFCINKKYYNYCRVVEVKKLYPQITDRILLELICILTKRYDYADQNWLTKCNDIKELKVSVLRLLLLCTSSTIEKYAHQVRTLFEEG